MEKLQLRVIFSMGPTLEGVRVRRISLAQIAAAAMKKKVWKMYVKSKCIEYAMAIAATFIWPFGTGCICHFC